MTTNLAHAFRAPTREILNIPMEGLFDEIEAHVRAEKYEAALALLGLVERFRARRPGRYPLEALLLSWKGLCTAFGENLPREGAELCMLALGQAFTPPACFLNLGRVQLAMGKRRAAYQAFRRGLELFPAHSELEAAIGALGIRRARALPALPREHFLNRALGGIRRLRRRLAVAAE